MKRLFSAAVVVLAALMLSGCLEIVSGSSWKNDMKKAAESGDTAEIERIAEEQLEKNDSDAVRNEAARYSLQAGDTALAEKYLLGLTGDPYKEVIISYAEAAVSATDLSGLKEAFPSEADVLFGGKPFPECSASELEDFRLTDDSGEECFYILRSAPQNGADSADAPALGIEWTDSRQQALMKLGFAETSAKLLLYIDGLSLTLTENGTECAANVETYAPFSQHPEVTPTVTLRYGNVRLSYEFGSNLARYGAAVYPSTKPTAPEP